MMMLHNFNTRVDDIIILLKTMKKYSYERKLDNSSDCDIFMTLLLDALFYALKSLIICLWCSASEGEFAVERSKMTVWSENSPAAGLAQINVP